MEWNGGMEYWNSKMLYFIPHLNKAYIYPDAAQAVSVSVSVLPTSTPLPTTSHIPLYSDGPNESLLSPLKTN